MLGKEFPSYFNRFSAALLAALIRAMPFLLKALHMPFREIVGGVPVSRGWRQFAVTFLLALGSVGSAGVDLPGALAYRGSSRSRTIWTLVGTGLGV